MFSRLVDRIEELQGIVYIEPAVGLSSDGMGGCLLFIVGGSRNDRYLRILIDRNASTDRLIIVIAHELQHALEVLEDPHVVDSSTMESLFDRIGIQGQSAHGVLRHMETAAAQRVSSAVSKELRQNRR